VADSTEQPAQTTPVGDSGAGGPAQRQVPATSDEEPTIVMPPHIFYLAVTYLLLLVAIFVTYVSWPAFRSNAPMNFGQLPVGVIWFGAVGAEIASLYGIFVHNQTWKASYNYWHYCRPLFGAITGSIGALIYLVLLELGSTTSISVDRTTFYVAAFVFGFADKSFTQMIQNVTAVLIKPGNKTSG
jgi:hypothetical protein